jgi:hypothetical protein
MAGRIETRQNGILIPVLHDLVYLFAPPEAEDAKDEQSGCGTPEPPEIVHILTWNFEIATEHASHDIHGQNNCTQDCQLAEDISGLREPVSIGTIDGKYVISPFLASRSCGC